MRRRRLPLLAAILLLAMPLSSSDGYIYPSGDGIYEDMESLFLLEGRTGLHPSRPWSQGEVKSMLSLLDGELPEGVSGKLYRRIESALAEEDYLRFSLSLSPEIYVHTNDEAFITPEKWAYGFEERNPFLLASVDAGLGPFSTYTELSYGWGYFTHNDEFRSWDGGIGAIVPEGEKTSLLLTSAVYSKIFTTSFPDIESLCLETPGRTSLSLGWNNLLLAFSRDDLSWGSSHIGNFIFDRHVSGKTYLTLKAFNGKFGFDYVLYFPEVDYSEMNGNVYEGKTRLMMAHMLTWNILDNLSLSISENIMGNFAAPELPYLNPAYLFHNLNNSRVLNAIAHAELEYVPTRGVSIKAQFVLDQATAPTESNEQPPTWGLSLYGDSVLPVGTADLVKVHLEGAYTTPFLYRRDAVDFLVFTRRSTNVTYRKYPSFTYLGFPYGGDAIALDASLAYERLTGFETTLDLLAVIKGGTNMFTAHAREGNAHCPDIRLRTPSEGGYRAWRVSWDTRYRKSFPLGETESFVNLALVTIGSDLDFQLSLGTRLTF